MVDLFTCNYFWKLLKTNLENRAKVFGGATSEGFWRGAIGLEGRQKQAQKMFELGRESEKEINFGVYLRSET